MSPHSLGSVIGVDPAKDIAEFLSSRRAKVTPERVGLPTYGPRRVKGLRREEVAALAGVSVDYYKRLERGRFRMPAITADRSAIEMDGTGLAMLLDGIDVSRVRRPEHWRPKLRKSA